MREGRRPGAAAFCGDETGYRAKPQVEEFRGEFVR